MNYIPEKLRLTTPIGRREYVIAIAVIIGIFYNLDRFLSLQSLEFNLDLSVSLLRWDFNYFKNSFWGEFAAALSVINGILILIILFLSFKRFRDVGLSIQYMLFLFIPLVQVFFIGLLCLLPGQQSTEHTALSKTDDFLKRLLPQSKLGSAMAGVAISVLLSLLFTLFSIYTTGNYGLLLFLGVPFLGGFFSVIVFCVHRDPPWHVAFSVASLSQLCLGGMLLLLAIEGIICLLMAMPIAIIFGILGGMLAHTIMQRRKIKPAALLLILPLSIQMPLMMTFEATLQAPPPLHEVRTTISIDAPASAVWQEVIAFSEIPEPREWWFRSGIAYPIRARIIGSGAGAIRHCEFSTGAFVEPIEIWREGELLQFSVSENPPVMEEWSFYGSIEAPHITDYFYSERGQFKLTPLPNGSTLLEGTTWYRHQIYPAWYWRLWTDEIIHRIHQRVLGHIKRQVEDQR